jgi:hypothetical protein
MALTATQLQGFLDALDTAILTGARVVRFQDRTIEYQTVADMYAARVDGQAKLDTLNATVQVRQHRVYTDKGWAD